VDETIEDVVERANKRLADAAEGRTTPAAGWPFTFVKPPPIRIVPLRSTRIAETV